MEIFQNELKQIKQFIKEQAILSKEILTVDEVTFYLGLSKSSVYKLTSNGDIPSYSPGGKKLYFKRSELEDWVFNSKVITVEDEELEVEDYLNRANKI